MVGFWRSAVKKLRFLPFMLVAMALFFPSFAGTRLDRSVGNSPQRLNSLVVDEPIEFDSFLNKTSERSIRDHLDALIEVLSKKNDASYIISYAGVSENSCDPQKVLVLAASYLKKKGVRRDRLVFVLGGFASEGRTEIFLVPGVLIRRTQLP
jgi:hypothetical protein